MEKKAQTSDRNIKFLIDNSLEGCPNVRRTENAGKETRYLKSWENYREQDGILYRETTISEEWIEQFITKTCLFKYTENFTTKNENFQIKNSNIFFLYISAQNIDCGYPLEPPRRGGSNTYPQSMFLSRNKENNVYPVNPSFTI